MQTMEEELTEEQIEERTMEAIRKLAEADHTSLAEIQQAIQEQSKIRHYDTIYGAEIIS